MSRYLKHKRSYRIAPFYQIEQAFSGLWSNRIMTVASILVLAACLVVIGSFYLVIRNINYNTADFSHLNKMVAYIDEAYTEKQVGEVKAAVEQMQDMVEGVTLVSKEQALQEEKDKYKEDYPHMFDVLDEGDNPYRDSLEVTYLDGVDVDTVTKALESVEGIERVVAYADIANSVAQLKSIISRVFSTFIVILFVVTVFVIILTIRFVVVTHREEVKIMRYVGATTRFIAIPYILEGAIIGAVSAGIATFLQGYLYGYIARSMSGAITALPYSKESLFIALGFFAIGIITGVLGSAFTLYRYLRV